MDVVRPNAHLTQDGALLHPTCREPYLQRRLAARLEGVDLRTAGLHGVDYGDVLRVVVAHPAATCVLCGESFGIERTKGKVHWPPWSKKKAPRWKPLK